LGADGDGLRLGLKPRPGGDEPTLAPLRQEGRVEQLGIDTVWHSDNLVALVFPWGEAGDRDERDTRQAGADQLLEEDAGANPVTALRAAAWAARKGEVVPGLALSLNDNRRQRLEEQVEHKALLPPLEVRFGELAFGTPEEV
jgi:hypothetical protein